MTPEELEAFTEKHEKKVEQLNDPVWCQAIEPFKEEVKSNLSQLFTDTVYVGISHSPVSWDFISNIKESEYHYLKTVAPIEAIAQKLFDDICDEIMAITTEPAEVFNIFESNKESYQNRVIQALEDMEEYFE